MLVDMCPGGGYDSAQEVRMKKAAVVCALLLLASAAFAENNFFKGTLDAAMAKAKAENKKLLLDFNSYT
jgi:hypothetical protein